MMMRNVNTEAMMHTDSDDDELERKKSQKFGIHSTKSDERRV